MRLMVLIAMAVLFAIIGGLFSIPLLIRDPIPVARPDVPITLGRDDVASPIAARLVVDRSGRFRVVLGLPPANGFNALPRLVLDMPHHDMTPVEPEVQRLADGRFLAAGVIAMPGRWRLAVEADGYRHILEFIVTE